MIFQFVNLGIIKMVNKEIVEKIVQAMVRSYANQCLKHMPKELNKRDYIDYSTSITASFLATIFKAVQEQTESSIDMKKTLNTLHETLKFHLTKRN